MSYRRRPGAPRLIEWTGERCVPWTPHVDVVYEHFQRYLWAAEIVEGRRVLDLASGEGFGSAILADTAAFVCGVDLDERAVEHSRVNYAAANLGFSVGSALDLSQFEDGEFGAVTCFELIEHVADHEGVFAEILRVLGPDGLLVISTPDRRVYTESLTGQENPYHEHELSEPEFRTLLSSHFPHVALWGQRTITGARLSTLDDTGSERTSVGVLERAGDDWMVGGEPTPMYLLGVASRTPLSTDPSREAILADYGLELMRTHERDAADARRETESAVHERDEARTRVTEAYRESDVHIRRAERALDATAKEVDRLLGQVDEQRAELNDRDAQLAAHRGEIAQLHQRIKRVDESVTWKAFERLRGKLYGAIGGQRSILGRLLSASLRGVGRLTKRKQPKQLAPEEPPIVLQRLDTTEPVASLIIPVHANADLTRACLVSIQRNTRDVPYEVILVDDDADEATKRLLRAVENAHVIVNERNLHFLRSMNRGAEIARGRYVVLMNNDIEVQAGWLKCMIRRAEAADDIAIVTPKFLFPDGSINEAGAIVWRDGTAWNVGRGHDAELPHHNYVREVDYGSAAALLVRTDFYREIGGFDERFAPIYYEDADLCFQARAHGLRVIYEPKSVVVHKEGATMGTDLSAGGKRNQAVNRSKFVEKWKDRLETEHHHTDPKNVRNLSNRAGGDRVLVIDDRIPRPDRDAGSVRMKGVMEALIEVGCRVTFLPDNLARHEPYAGQLQDVGIEVLYGSVDLNAELVSLGPALRLVIVSRPYVAARYLHLLREYCPSARIVYDTVDLHFVREQRRAALGNGSHVHRKAESMRELELALVRGTDATAVITEEERQHLLREVPGAHVEVIPMVHDLTLSVPPAEGRAGIAFVGGFQHPPNADAVHFLVEDVMPLVWDELGDVTLTVVGPDLPPDVAALAQPGIEMAGWVPDLEPLLRQTRVMVAPLRYGAGMKGKVTQSLAAGLPVVTTSVGAEGLAAVDGETLLVSDEASGLAERIVRLYRDDVLWRRLSVAGQKTIEQHASRPTVEASLRSLLERA